MTKSDELQHAVLSMKMIINADCIYCSLTELPNIVEWQDNNS